MSLSSVDSITRAVDYDPDGFSFLSTVGELIGNREYSRACLQYEDGADNASTFYWKTLSAIGEDLSETVYNNVKNYIQYVSDVDTCKVKALRSMMQLFNYKCTVLDNFMDMPVELLKLIDVMSIDKKYLARSGFIRPELAADMASSGVFSDYATDQGGFGPFRGIDFRSDFTNCTYVISTDAHATDGVEVGRMQWKYGWTQCISDFVGLCVEYGVDGSVVTCFLDPARLHELTEYYKYPLSSIQQISSLNTASMYANKKGYYLIDDRQYDVGNGRIYVCDGNLSRLFYVRTSYNGIRFPGDSMISALSDVYAELSGEETASLYAVDWLRSNIEARMSFELSSDAVAYGRNVFNNDKYLDYVRSVYERLLYGYITLPYNISVNYMTHANTLYAYPYLGSDYFDISAKYDEYVGYEDDPILSVKLRNHVSRSFNEKRIYDDIEAGRDSLDSYAGAELCVLMLEKAEREAPLSFVDMQLPDYYSRSQLALKQNQTRYSFYRKRKVAEYANFVDRYYAVIRNSSGADIYDFDSNYWQLSPSAVSNKVITRPTSIDRVNPSVDIDRRMIGVVADYLAMATQYICKLRHEIKLQTQKNYMRGTNLLLIYIINEYLRNYANHNNLSTDILASDSEFQSIQKKLASHSLEGASRQGYSVNVQEYYDQTEYFNIATNSTASADMSASVNPRYWEITDINSAGMMKRDGDAFKLAEIERFYLSSLGLERGISGDLPTFLSTIYDLGANNTFIYKDLSNGVSAYSTVLSNGQFASDIYNDLICLSNAYMQFVGQYLSGGTYQYPEGTISDQISDVLNNYVYPNLSAQYLIGISDVYDTYKVQIDGLSGSIDSLYAKYVRFTQTTYACYYSKSESKFCYTDRDPVAGQYVFPYFNGNPDYDKEDNNLYNRLYQLQVYSTESNIRNFALISTLSYVDTEMKSISGDLQENVVTHLVSDCGFTDINAPTLDNELQYAYNFVNNLIGSRQSFLKTQLASLQAQAQQLKTSYDNLNNTFTNAVANFNDNNAGYKLGDGKIYWFSTYTDKDKGTAAKKDEAPTKTEWDYAVYVADAGCKCWYCGIEGETKGQYVRGFTDLAERGLQYNAEDSLKHRCDCVLEYMNSPTSKTVSGFQYGLMNEGIVAVCGNVKAGLADMQTSFNNIAEQAQSMFGIEKPQQTDIYNNILELIQKLTAVDEAAFVSDEKTQKYKSYFAKIIQLSSSYTPVKSEYGHIFADKSQTNYLVGFSKQDGLTFENIRELSIYIEKTDKSNHQSITQEIDQFIDVDFQDLMNQKLEIQARMEGDGVPGVVQKFGTDIEHQVGVMLYDSDAKAGIVQDVINKQEAAYSNIDSHKFSIYNNYGRGYMNIITSNISAELGTTKKFTSCVKARLEQLNFFDHDIYNKYKGVFLTYGGRDFCYDPYYNIKNTVHPSYQIHPYLWNFVKKIDGTTLINTGFHAAAVDQLIQHNVLEWIEKNCPGGYTVDTWKRSNDGLIDYSGYRSMYEQGQNWSSKLNSVHEGIDYEGAFYPPALNEYTNFTQQSISSVYERMTRRSLYEKACQELDRQLTGDVSSYVTFKQNGTIWPASGSRFINIAQGVVLKYAPSSMCRISAAVTDYLARKDTTISTLSWSGVKNAVLNGTPDTFYERYYSHIDLTHDETRRIGMQLREYKADIFELTEPKLFSEQYDIYKYGIDLNKTNYILFKKYDYSAVEEQEDLSYDAKRNTLGQLWIRLGDHPIAFPAFSGSNPAYYIHDIEKIHPAIVALAQKRKSDTGITWGDAGRTVISSINDKVQYFYDFEIAPNKASIAYVIFDPKYPVDVDFYRQFKLANIIAGKIGTCRDGSTDVLYLKFYNSAAGASGVPTDYIEFHKNNTFGYVSDEDILSSEALLSDGVRYPALVGYHVFENNSINMVYTYQDFKATPDGAQLSDLTRVHADMSRPVRSFVVQVKNGDTYKKIPDGDLTFDVDSQAFAGRRIVGDSMCVGYNRSSEQLTFVYTTELTAPRSGMAEVETASCEIDISSASDGAIITDPLAPEMNSYDMFQQNITLVRAGYSSDLLKLKSVSDYNMNADISYIPVYPGYEHEFSMPARYGVLDSSLCCLVVSGDYQNIQLLGESKDIERYIALVNPNPDPYFNYQSVKENTEFGRVYEDYRTDLEKTFTMVENPSLNFNSPAKYWNKYSIQTTQNQFIWTINLNRLNPTPFSIRDLKTMQVIIYNANTLGKNPYYIGSLWDFTVQRELNYNKPIDTENNADSDTSCVVSTGDIRVTGTHRDIHTHSVRDTNYIEMVDRITVSMYATEGDEQNATLTFTFDINQNAPLRQFANVPQGELKIMLYNNKDLEIYQYYHMLDAYGAVQCKFFEQLDDIQPDQPDDGRGWGVYFPNAARSGVSALTHSFFRDKSGLKTYLDSVQLSDYESLSDVYVYRGNKMLSFKNEEQYRFPVSSDLYYYPTLNISYPKKAANYVEQNTSFSVNDSANTSVMYDIFNERNIFVITLEDSMYIADKIGQVDIPILYNDVDDVRAYEDYLDFGEVSPGLSAYNYQRYDKGDPRIAQYLHFTSVANVKAGEGISVPESSWKNKSVDDFAAWAATGKSMYTAKSEDITQGIETEYVTTYVSRHTCDIQKFLRLYVNYRRSEEDNSIELYFNYFNYIDSPYVRLENGTEMKIDTVPSTYLKLKSGEDGVLDIIIQFKYYIGSVLYGYKNVKALSYRVYNISDDKPKFLLYKTYEVQPGQSKRQIERATAKFSVDSQTIQLEDYAPDRVIEGVFRVSVYSDKQLAGPYDFYFDYPNEIVTVPDEAGTGYYIDRTGSSLGMLHVIVTNPSQRSYAFRYSTKYKVSEMLRYRNRKYLVSVDEASAADSDGLACKVETQDASIQFTYTTSNLLGVDNIRGATGAYVAADKGRSVISLSSI